MTPTALRALAAQLEQAGWTNVAATSRGGLLSISGTDPNGVSRATAATPTRALTASQIVNNLKASLEPTDAS